VAGAVLSELPGGKIIREVSRQVLGREDAPEAVLADALRNPTPEAMQALRALEAEYTARLRVEAEDRADARRAAQGELFPVILASAIILGFFGVLAAMMFVEPPEGVREVLLTLTGLLGGAVSSVVAFYFGSSSGSKAKTAILGRKG